MKVVPCLLFLLPLVCGYGYQQNPVVQQCQPSTIYDTQTASVVVSFYVTATVDKYVTQTQYLTETATQYSYTTVVSTVRETQYVTVSKTKYKTHTQHHTDTIYSTQVQVETSVFHSTIKEPQYMTRAEVMVSTVFKVVPHYVTATEEVQTYVTVIKKCHIPHQPKIKYNYPIVFKQKKNW